MEGIGKQEIWSYFDGIPDVRLASNTAIRGGSGHKVNSYMELAKKVAELQFLNRNHVLLFRGQKEDHRTSRNNSMLKPSIFRLNGKKRPSRRVMWKRFSELRIAENELVNRYLIQSLTDPDRLKRHRNIRWAVLQHYEICDTPLFDVTNSLRIAVSFASDNNQTEEAFVFAFGVLNLNGAITTSSEAGLQVIRLSSACPPEAIRPHIQEGYLIGEYPEISEFQETPEYEYYEVDFGRRLVAKFRFDPKIFLEDMHYPLANHEALYPDQDIDPLIKIAAEIKSITKKRAMS